MLLVKITAEQHRFFICRVKGSLEQGLEEFLGGEDEPGSLTGVAIKPLDDRGCFVKVSVEGLLAKLLDSLLVLPGAALSQDSHQRDGCCLSIAVDVVLTTRVDVDPAVNVRSPLDIPSGHEESIGSPQGLERGVGSDITLSPDIGHDASHVSLVVGAGSLLEILIQQALAVALQSFGGHTLCWRNAGWSSGLNLLRVLGVSPALHGRLS